MGPMGIVIPPSRKAMTGITTSPVLRSVSIFFGGQYLTPTFRGMQYVTLNSSNWAGLSTRYWSLPITLKRKDGSTERSDQGVIVQKSRKLAEEKLKDRKDENLQELNWRLIFELAQGFSKVLEKTGIDD
nr:hypothetical protein CFP56_31959 [Quercus suber]